MKLHSPTVGPIVGYTTPTQTRMMIRGVPERDTTGFRRCFGVVRWRPAGSEEWSDPVFNKLSPNFDMTGVLVLDKLKPDTDYEYQAGWFFAEAELERIQSLAATQIEWLGATLRFRSGTVDAAASRSYVVGSCRYLLRLFGGTFFDDRGDKTFRSVLEQIDKTKQPLDALLMIGDQIYADDLNVLSPDTRIDQYLDRMALT